MLLLLLLVETRVDVDAAAALRLEADTRLCWRLVEAAMENDKFCLQPFLCDGLKFTRSIDCSFLVLSGTVVDEPPGAAAAGRFTRGALS